MGGKITLEVTRGALAGQRFEYGEKTRIFIGRQEDCGIVLPESTVSRYHCVLEITPPEVKLQDFGSLNGTFLNGTKIGGRGREQSWESAKDERHDEYTLRCGDVLGLGSKCELRCMIEGGEVCASCGAALSDGISGNETVPESDERASMHYNSAHERICEDCYLAAEKERLEKRIAEKRAAEEADKKAAEEARLAAERAERERKAEEERNKERQRQAVKKQKLAQEEAERKREAEARERAKAEKKRLEDEARVKAAAAAKAEANRKEAERLAAQLAAQIAENKPKQKECAECGKPFTPTAPDNNLCPDCLTDRAKVLDGILKAMLGDGSARAREQAVGPAPIKGYQKVKLLGKGGMGEVWKVRDEDTGKTYALKTMLPAVKADESAVKLFLREAGIGQCLKHKNVVATYQAGCENDTFYILMDLCEGGSVDSLMEKKGGKLSIELATWIMLQVLSGLDYVHNMDVAVEIQKGLFRGTKETQAKGVIHRDFKPGNIFLSDAGDKPTAMVADFGMAKAFDVAGLSRITKTGTVMGTPVFMPRQQAINFKYAKPEVDVWAAAASYYNMLTGAFPKNFRPGKNVWQIIVTEPAVPIRDRNSAIPQSVASVIDKALREQPEIGYKTAADLRRDLVAALPSNVKNAVKGVL